MAETFQDDVVTVWQALGARTLATSCETDLDNRIADDAETVSNGGRATRSTAIHGKKSQKHASRSVPDARVMSERQVTDSGAFASRACRIPFARSRNRCHADDRFGQPLGQA